MTIPELKEYIENRIKACEITRDRVKAQGNTQLSIAYDYRLDAYYDLREMVKQVDPSVKTFVDGFISDLDRIARTVFDMSTDNLVSDDVRSYYRGQYHLLKTILNNLQLKKESGVYDNRNDD